MITWVAVSLLERSIKSVFLIGAILFIRKKQNLYSMKWANMLLWILLLIYLLLPYSILFQIDNQRSNGILYLIALTDDFLKNSLKLLGGFLSKLNRTMIAVALLLYILFQIQKRNHTMKKSVPVVASPHIMACIDLFRIKRKIEIYLNDDIKVPITYGVIFPKVILQSHILRDEELLKYVLIHELTHIKKFDILFSHFKNLVACLHWYNPLILATLKYMEEDMEILCDKLVIQKVGDNMEHRKQYCLSMYRLLEKEETKSKIVLNLHPTMERIMIMKKWKKTSIGIFTFVFVMLLSATAFIEIRAVENSQVEIISGAPQEIRINADGRVEIISEEEYQNLKLGDIPLVVSRAANIDENVTLEGLGYKSYQFNMESWTEANHDGFTVKISDVSCSDGVDYEIKIYENERIIYRQDFDNAITLKVKGYVYGRYVVKIDNNSMNSFSYKAKINSYIR